jgi:hypothetical protein
MTAAAVANNVHAETCHEFKKLVSGQMYKETYFLSWENAIGRIWFANTFKLDVETPSRRAGGCKS